MKLKSLFNLLFVPFFPRHGVFYENRLLLKGNNDEKLLPYVLYVP